MSEIEEIIVTLKMDNGEEVSSSISDPLLKFILSTLNNKGENPFLVFELLCKLGFSIPEIKNMVLGSISSKQSSKFETKADIVEKNNASPNEEKRQGSKLFCLINNVASN